MKFSLILATIGRVKEIEHLIISLINQTYKNFELIIIDQNEHDEINYMYNKYKEYIDIKYVKVNSVGLSYARNVGIKYITGDVVSFPDDDCEYHSETLEKVKYELDKHDIDILTFRILDKVTNRNSCGNWANHEIMINKYNVFNTAISITIFIKIKNINEIVFDENLGVGTKLSSGEETDLILSLLYKKYVGKYVPNIYVYHDNKPKDLSRGYQYSLGTGAVYYKEIVLRKNYFYVFKYLMSIVKPIFISFYQLINRNYYLCNYNISIVKGRIRGARLYNNRNLS